MFALLQQLMISVSNVVLNVTCQYISQIAHFPSLETILENFSCTYERTKLQ